MATFNNNFKVKNGLDASGVVTSAGLSLLSTTSPITLNGSAGTSGQILTSAGAGLTPTWSSSFSGFLSTTNTGRTGNISFITPGASSQATWANYPVGLGTMVNANQSANGTPTNNFQYFLKVANRDFGGGWGGLSIDYATGDLYVGRANESVNYATWHRMANTSLANTFTEPMSVTPSGNVTALTVTQNAGGRSLIFGASGLLNTATSVTGNPSWNSVATSEVYGTLSTRVVELLRGISNQTADTLQIQSSAGTVLGGRNAVGQIFTGSTSPINYQVGGTPTATSGTGSVATINLTSASNLAVGDLIQLTGFTPTAYNTTGYVLVTAVSNSPTFSVSYASAATGAMTVAGQVQTIPQTSITARSAATVPLIIKGNGFNMNLQTWLKSDGNPGIIVNPYGSLVGSASANQFNSDNGANFILRTAGTADQRGNHYQVVNSSSTILAGFNGQGQIFTGATTPIQGTTSVVIGTQTPTGTTNISITTGAAHGILVGQTVVIAGVTPTGYNGTWTAQSGTTGTTLVVNIGSNPGAITVAGTVTQNSQVGIVAPSANNTPLVVRAAASQVANVLEAQNSSGTVIANITSAGGVRATGTLQGSTLSSVADGSTIATLSASGNIQFRGAASYGGGVGVIGIANAGTAPTSNPTGGGVLFVETGALKYRGTSNAAATIVNADGTNPLLSSNNTFSGTQSMTSPSITTSITTTTVGAFDLINTTATTINAFGAASTVNLGTAANSVTIGNSGTLGSGAQTVNLFTGGSTTGTNQTINLGTGNFGFATQTINIGTGTISSATRTINIGSSSGTGTANLRGTVNFAGTTSPIQLDGSVGTSGQVLTSAGTGATPTWSTVLSANNPLLTSISTVGGGGAEGGQINFARVTDGTAYWYIDSFGSTSTPNFRIVENTTPRLEVASGGALSISGQTGTTGQILASQGSASAPTWTTPVYGTAWTAFASGNYYNAQGGTQANATPALNTMTLVPFALTVSTTFTKIGIYVNTGGTGSTVRLGIYNSTNGVASTLLLDAGTVATTTSASLALITINQTLAPGLYWLAAVSQGATCAAMCKSTGHVPMVPYIGSPANSGARGHQVTGTSGALPNPVGTLAMASSPFEVFLQL